MALVHQHLQLVLAYFLPEPISRRGMHLGYHLCIKQLIVALSSLMLLVERHTTVKISCVAPCASVCLVQLFVVDGPFPPLSSLEPTSQSCIAQLSLLVVTSIESLVD